MKILGIIPARGGSKGIPRKNIKPLGGKPLIQFTYESVKESNLLTRTIISTDDKEIASVCKKLRMDVPFLRPSEFADDGSPTLPVILHALKYLEETNQERYDAVLLLQPTTPFRQKGLIDLAINQFIKQKTDSLISVTKVPHIFNPHWVFEVDENNYLKIATGENIIISQRQKLPKAFIRDGAVYITSVDVLYNKRSLYGDTISYIENEKSPQINLDTMKDWRLAEEYLKHKERNAY